MAHYFELVPITMSDQPPLRLDIICIGRIDTGAIEALDGFSLSTSEIEPREGAFAWADCAEPVNRAIDDAGGWVLLLREGERVTPSLAAEIGRLAVDKPVAWAFRIPLRLVYAGGPLYRRTPRSGGEIRLFHCRRCRFLPKGGTRELQSRGTVIRISHPIERKLHSSVEAHLAAVSAERVPHSFTRRALLFLKRSWGDRTRLTIRSLRYHWIEAGWDRGSISDESSGDRM